MQFYIYREGAAHILSNGEGEAIAFPSEAAAIDEAVRIAQDRGGAYGLNYWRP